MRKRTMIKFQEIIKSLMHPHPRLDEVKEVIAEHPKILSEKQVFDIVNDAIMNEYDFLCDQMDTQLTQVDDEERVRMKQRIIRKPVIQMFASRVYRDCTRSANMHLLLEHVLHSTKQDLTEHIQDLIQYGLVPLMVDIIYRRTKLTKGGDSYEVPQGVRDAAQRGLELRREYGHGGLDSKQAGKLGIGSGVQRASNLIQGRVSKQTIKRMYSFFSRHSAYKKFHKDKSSKANISWLLWGGDAGFTWAKKMINQFEREEQKNEN